MIFKAVCMYDVLQVKTI